MMFLIISINIPLLTELTPLKLMPMGFGGSLTLPDFPKLWVKKSPSREGK